MIHDPSSTSVVHEKLWERSREGSRFVKTLPPTTVPPDTTRYHCTTRCHRIPPHGIYHRIPPHTTAYHRIPPATVTYRHQIPQNTTRYHHIREWPKTLQCTWVQPVLSLGGAKATQHVLASFDLARYRFQKVQSISVDLFLYCIVLSLTFVRARTG